MNVVCCSPWRAASLLWQPRPGAWAFTVACHAAFELAAGESLLVPKPLSQRPLDGANDDRSFVEPWGPVAPIKRQPEVMVVGHAYAPAGTKVTSLAARLGVGELEKLIHVQGDSYFSQEGSLVGPAPFAQMPLRWERAAGAPYTSNPLGAGMGPEAIVDAHGRVGLPNLLPIGTFVSSRDQVVPPIGFGPIRPGWPSRTERLHRYAATWDPERWAERALPDDFDISYFNAAPPDQRVHEITGSERIVLEHLHPRFARLVTYLRAPAPCAVVSSMGVEQSVPLQCDTLVFDTDRGLAILVWRGHVQLDHPQQEGVVVVSSALLGAAQTGTVDSAAVPKPKPALPFAGDAAETVVGSSFPTKPALPFAGDAAAALGGSSYPTKPALPIQRSAVETVVGSSFPTSSALPFHQPPEPELEPLPAAHDTADTEPPTPRQASEVAQLPSAASAEPPPTAIPEASPPPSVRPPPIRLHVVEVADEPPPLPLPLPPPPRPTVASSIEHCATVAARLAAPRADRAAILEAEELTPEQWESQHARWLGEINDELDRGKKKLLSAYDEAYVAALEDGRGPISAGEYARLSVAVDRGKIATVLAELDLPDDAMMRIRRVWLARMVKDPKAAAEVRVAMRVAREA